ncbi:MAG: protein TolR [Deltaproteobacteria bacterium]|nr:protein TolR [Deltaproteobacteria bacterium]
MAFDSKGGGGSMSQINVTPLVDVMLVLLVIFMVTAPMLQQGVNVELPRADVGPLEGRDAPVVVSLTRGGEIFLNERSLSREQLVEELRGRAEATPDEPVYVRADESLPYGEVISVMGVIRSAGIKNVGMVTQLPSQGG